MKFLTTATPMNKTHQIWQATNAMAMGFFLGQTFHVLDGPVASLAFYGSSYQRHVRDAVQ